MLTFILTFTFIFYIKSIFEGLKILNTINRKKRLKKKWVSSFFTQRYQKNFEEIWSFNENLKKNNPYLPTNNKKKHS